MPVSTPLNFSEHFLIAMSALQDSQFGRSVIYVCEHGEHGAFGLCINKPLQMTLADLFTQNNLPLQHSDLNRQNLCWGGPLEPERGFILHPAQTLSDESCMEKSSTTDSLQITASKNIFHALSEGQGPSRFFAALGYSSWNSGQLEDEIKNNSWLTVPANHSLIFDVPIDERYDRSILSLGVQPWALSSYAGTA